MEKKSTHRWSDCEFRGLTSNRVYPADFEQPRCCCTGAILICKCSLTSDQNVQRFPYARVCSSKLSLLINCVRHLITDVEINKRRELGKQLAGWSCGVISEATNIRESNWCICFAEWLRSHHPPSWTEIRCEKLPQSLWAHVEETTIANITGSWGGIYWKRCIFFGSGMSQLSEIMKLLTCI